MATYNKRANGNWQAKIRLKGFKAVSKTFKKKADAKQWADETERRMKLKGFIPSENAGKSIDWLCDRYISMYKRKRKKKGREADGKYLIRIENIRQRFGDVAVDKLTSEDIGEWQLEQLERGLKENTVNRNVSVLRAMYNKPLKEAGIRLMGGNPFDYVSMMDASYGSRTRLIKESEFHEIINEVKQDNCVDVPLIMTLLWLTGMRSSEAIDIRAEDIAFDPKTEKPIGIRIMKNKESKPRLVLLSDQMAGVLVKLAGERQITKGRIFEGASYWQLSRAMKKAVDKLGYNIDKDTGEPLDVLHRMTLHSFRHTRITIWHNEGKMTVDQIMEVVGHHSRELHMKTYAKPDTTRLRDVAVDNQVFQRMAESF